MKKYQNEWIDRVTPAQKTIVRSDFVPLFDGPNNPNHDIFVIPTLEGSDSDDQWNGSIGDATVEHLYSMRHKLHEIENYVHMPNGNLFRVEQNVSPPDEDGHRALKNDIMKLMTAQPGRVHDTSATVLTGEGSYWHAARSASFNGARAPLVRENPNKQEIIDYFKEEIELAKEARLDKMDAMDQPLVSFEDWETTPGLTNSIDIPSTPVPLYIYAGNTTQMFYDSIPEDHPDLKKINAFLSIANSIEWDSFDDKTVSFFEGWLFNDNQNWQDGFAPSRLFTLCEDIRKSDTTSPSTLTSIALEEIDSNWGATIRPVVLGEFFRNDPVMKEMKEFRKELAAKRIEGKLSWAELGRFAQSIYKRYKGQMNSIHWKEYRQMKKDFAPAVCIGTIDVNSATMSQLRDIFSRRFQKEIDAFLFGEMSDYLAERGVKKIRAKIENMAAWVYFNTPFMSLEDLASEGLIGIEDIGYTPKTVGIISLMKKAQLQCIATRSSSPLGKMAMQVANLQRSTPEKCTEQEWFSLWQVYRILKGSVQKSLGLTS